MDYNIHKFVRSKKGITRTSSLKTKDGDNYIISVYNELGNEPFLEARIVHDKIDYLR